MKQENWFAFLLMVVVSATLWPRAGVADLHSFESRHRHTLAVPQTVSDSFPTWFERLDFVAIDQQTVYSTQAQPRSNFVFVFHNGLLQTQEQNPTTCAPSCADYTAATASGKRTITFLQPNGAGDRVTLWYWR